MFKEKHKDIDLLYQRYNKYYADRLVNAYHGKESICSIAKDYGISRQAVWYTIERYLGRKKRFKKKKPPKCAIFIDSFKASFPECIDSLNNLSISFNYLSQYYGGYCITSDHAKMFFLNNVKFRFCSRRKVRTKGIIPIDIKLQHLAGKYIVIAPWGIAIKELKKGYNSIKKILFMKNHTEITQKLLKESGLE